MGQRGSIYLDQDDRLHWHMVDISCCSHIHGNPAAWGKCFSLNCMFAPEGLCLPRKKSDEEVYVALNGFRMGWLSADGVIQCLVPWLTFVLSGIPSQVELRRDRPLPVDQCFMTLRLVQVYIDSIDEAAFTKVEFDEGCVSESMCARRRTADAWGVPFADDEKRVEAALKSLPLGVRVRDDLLLFTSSHRMVNTFAGILGCVLSASRVHFKHVEWCRAIGSTLCHSIALRLPPSAALGLSWPRMWNPWTAFAWLRLKGAWRGRLCRCRRRISSCL